MDSYLELNLLYAEVLLGVGLTGLANPDTLLMKITDYPFCLATAYYFLF